MKRGSYGIQAIFIAELINHKLNPASSLIGEAGLFFDETIGARGYIQQ